MSHTAEIIAVGTEILLGNIANTDAQMLSQSLSTLGVNVFWCRFAAGKAADSEYAGGNCFPDAAVQAGLVV